MQVPAGAARSRTPLVRLRAAAVHVRGFNKCFRTLIHRFRPRAPAQAAAKTATTAITAKAFIVAPLAILNGIGLCLQCLVTMIRGAAWPRHLCRGCRSGVTRPSPRPRASTHPFGNHSISLLAVQIIPMAAGRFWALPRACRRILSWCTAVTEMASDFIMHALPTNTALQPLQWFMYYPMIFARTHLQHP